MSRVNDFDDDDETAAQAGQTEAERVVETTGGSRFYTAEDIEADNDGTEEGASMDQEVAPRVTEADIMRDTRSLDRALADRLVLLVKRKSDGKWWFPEAERATGSSNRMTDVARVGMTECFENRTVDAYYPGQAPIGYAVTPRYTCKHSFHL